MTPPSRHHPSPIRVVLSSTALLRFMSVKNAAALAIAQLGVSAFFVSGVLREAIGDAAGWFIVAATGLSALVRAIDLESWALLMRPRRPCLRSPVGRNRSRGHAG
jgi:hypothetical protein